MSNYNLIASFYSSLATFVYGPSFYKIQADAILGSNAKSILVVGGGDLRFLENGAFKAIKITALDKSKKLSALASKRISKLGLEVEVILDDFSSFNVTRKFDLVVFPFFLDQFTLDENMRHITKASGLLSTKGKILIIDFKKPQTSFQKLYLKLLILGFKLITNLKISTLPTFNFYGFIKQERVVVEKFWYSISTIVLTPQQSEGSELS